jgi:hypothetical protein
MRAIDWLSKAEIESCLKKDREEYDKCNVKLKRRYKIKEKNEKKIEKMKKEIVDLEVRMRGLAVSISAYVEKLEEE